MSVTEGKFTVAALADLHANERRERSYRDLFAEISKVADAMVICGDLTDTGKRAEAEILAEELRACSIPMVAVLGNHDYESGQEEEIVKVLAGVGLRVLSGDGCKIGDIAFVGVKGFAGGFGARMLGSFGEPAIKAFVAETVKETMQLENAMRSVKGRRHMVVLHYAPVVETIEGEPLEIFPFLGSSRLAETIDRFPVDAIVHGHAHRGRHIGRTPGGAPVYNVAYDIEKPSGKPYALIEL